MPVEPVFEISPPEFKLAAWPCDFYCVIQHFCNLDPLRYPFPHFHCGIDLVCLEGRPYYAAANGEVDHVGFTAGNGHYIDVRHIVGSEVFHTRYAHNADENFPIISGPFQAGDIIGTCGISGNSDDHHLHFEIRLDNHTTDECDCPGFVNPWPKLEPLFHNPVIRPGGFLLGWLEEARLTQVNDGAFIVTSGNTVLFENSEGTAFHRGMFVGEAARKGFKTVRQNGRISLRVALSA